MSKKKEFIAIISEGEKTEKQIINNLQKYNFEAKKIKFCYTTEYKNAKIVLIEAIKNGKAGLTILPSLIINKENGEYTDEILKMFE